MADQKIDVNQLLKQLDAKRKQDAKALEAAKAAAEAAARKDSAAYDLSLKVRSASEQANRLQPQIDELRRSITLEVTRVAAGSVKPDVLQSLVERYNALVEKQGEFSATAVSLTSGATEPKTGAERPATGVSTIGDYQAAQAAAAATAKAKGKPAGAKTPAAGAETPTPTGGTTQTPTTRTTTRTPATKTATKTVTTKTPAKNAAGLTEAQQKRLGTYGSKYLLDYMKAEEPSLYKQLQQWALKGESAENVNAYLKNTQWYLDVNRRYRAPIAASAMANGLTVSASEIDKLRNQYLGGVKSLEEIEYDLAQRAITTYQLDANPNTVAIADAMRAGSTLSKAVDDYADIYTKTLGIASVNFKAGDPKFLDLIRSSSSLDDFERKVKRTPEFLAKPETQQAISDNAAMITQRYRAYGLNIDAKSAWNLSQQVYLGDTSDARVQENLTRIAAETFKPFKDRILNGEDPLSLAAPYLSAMSRILEIPSGQLDLEDPTVRKAMMGTVSEKNGATAVPIWEFEQNLYKDTRWQYTANARQTLDEVYLDVASRWGLIG